MFAGPGGCRASRPSGSGETCRPSWQTQSTGPPSGPTVQAWLRQQRLTLHRAGMHSRSQLAAVERASQQFLPLYRAGTHTPSLLVAVEQAA